MMYSSKSVTVLALASGVARSIQIGRKQQGLADSADKIDITNKADVRAMLEQIFFNSEASPERGRAIDRLGLVRQKTFTMDEVAEHFEKTFRYQLLVGDANGYDNMTGDQAWDAVEKEVFLPALFEQMSANKDNQSVAQPFLSGKMKEDVIWAGFFYGGYKEGYSNKLNRNLSMTDFANQHGLSLEEVQDVLTVDRINEGEMALFDSYLREVLGTDKYKVESLNWCLEQDHINFSLYEPGVIQWRDDINYKCPELEITSAEMIDQVRANEEGCFLYNEHDGKLALLDDVIEKDGEGPNRLKWIGCILLAFLVLIIGSFCIATQFGAFRKCGFHPQ